MVSEIGGKTTKVGERLGVRLRRATLWLRRLLMSRLTSLGFTLEQYVILLFLAEQDGTTQSELARRSFTNPNTVVDILSRLEADGLVRRLPHESDGRAYRVEITCEGDQVRKQLVAVADEVTRQVLEDMPATDRNILLTSLEAIAEAAGQALRGSQ